MQDRYLFKAKRKDDGEWVFGGLSYCEKTNAYFITNMGKDHISYIGFHQEVDSNTICQCTGLKDKNGRVICENDIIKHYNDEAHPESYCTGTVLWDENYVGFYRTSNEYGLSKPRISSDCIYEVIGNIFDSPELLEEQP